MKNKTLNDLEKLPDKPYDLPKNSNSKEEPKKINDNKDNKDNNNNNSSQNSTKINILTNTVSPNKLKANSIFDNINSKENYRFLSKLSIDNGYHFDLLKFKQNNNDDNNDKKKKYNDYYNDNDYNSKLSNKTKNENENKNNNNNNNNTISIFDILDKDNQNQNDKKNSQIKFQINQIENNKDKISNLTINKNKNKSDYNKEIENSLVEKFSKNLQMKMGIKMNMNNMNMDMDMGYDIFKGDMLKKENNKSNLNIIIRFNLIEIFLILK